MSQKTNGKNESTIVGYVDLIDATDGESGVVISTDKDQYIVEMNKQGRRLLNWVDEEVQATGSIMEDDEGNKHISIRSVGIIEYEQDPDDFDWDD